MTGTGQQRSAPAGEMALLDLLVIGAGVSGLAAAQVAHQSGARTLVLESAARVGGVLRSTRQDGYLYETGASEMLVKNAAMQEALRETGLEGEILEADPRAKNRFLIRGGRLHALPRHPLAFLRTPLWPVSGKFRLLKEPFIGRTPPQPEPTLAAFIERRLGKAFLDYGIGPLVSGVFAGDPGALSGRYAFPRMWDLEQQHGSIVLGFFHALLEKRRRGQKHRSRIISFRDGMETIPLRLAARLGDAVRLEASVERLEAGAVWTVQWREAGQLRQCQSRCLLAAVPAYELPQLPWPEAIRGALQPLAELPYAAVSTLFQGFHRTQIDHPLDGFGVLAPFPERRQILGTLFLSSLFPNRAPPGQVGLLTFIGGATAPQRAAWSEAEAARVTAGELTALLGLRGEPVFQRHVSWKRAIPQYNTGHGRFLDRLERLEKDSPGLGFTGGYRGGPGVGDCLINSRQAARRLLVAARG